MPWILVGILSIVVIVLSIKLSQKIQIDKAEMHSFDVGMGMLRNEYDTLVKNISERTKELEDYQNKILNVQETYRKELNKKTSDLDYYFANQRQLRMSELDTEFERLEQERKISLDERMRGFTRQAQERVNEAEAKAQNEIERWEQAQRDIADVTAFQEERFESLLEPLKKYEMDKQERLFYTIQVPDEYKDDIEFLLTTVAAKVQHPDIINKLVYAEYVKPYLDETFKRVDIKPDPGIYKITSLVDGKSYIGKSTNIKKRLADHMKASCGIQSIADQAVHHAIRKQGYWNWTIEPIIYCEKDQLSELEKYYIDFFKAQDFGYNKNSGG